MRIGAVIMASGYGKRFGSDKLLFPVGGVPMAERAVRALPEAIRKDAVLVAREPAVLELAEACGVRAVRNPDTTDDPAVTIRLGVEHLPKGCDGCLFLVGDQPWLTTATVETLCKVFEDSGGQRICAAAHGGRPGNPVIFPSPLFEELKSLPAYERGKAVIAAHPDLLVLQEVPDAAELKDIDYRSDLNPEKISS